MTTQEQYLALISKIVDSPNPAVLFAEMLKEAYREGKRAGIAQQRNNERWETPK